MKTLLSFRTFPNEEIKLRQEDFDDLYSECVKFCEEYDEPDLRYVYAHLSGAYQMLPVKVAFDVVAKLRADGFIK